jgi:hypothetical protein
LWGFAISCANLYFHIAVNNAKALRKAPPVKIRRLRIGSDNGDFDGVEMGADRPHMQVNDLGLTILFQCITKGLLRFLIGLPI